MRERDIFIAAVAMNAPERAAYLAAACGDDRELRRLVEELLAEHIREESFLLDAPPPGVNITIDQPPAEKPGTQIGPYKLLQQIGEGGMGVVYMAEQTEPVKRRVALKIIKPGMDTRQVIARFEAERQALSLMDHPNIAKVLDAGATASGRPYFVMELVKGQPITQYCDEHHLTPRQRLELLLPVCQAIQHAHQKGIIHRDIKPTNILVAEYDQQPVPKVIDFGVAKATSQTLTEKTMFTGYGQIVGTLEYMSPEQAKVNQLDIDTRSDIYSLGVLLYELLTGSTPFDRKRLRSAAFDEMLRIIREEEPPKPSTRLSDSHDSLPSISALRQTEPAKLTKLVRGELDWIVMKALEKDRNRRYETANGFAADVQRHLNDEPVQACPPSALYRFRKFARRNKVAVAVTGLVLFFLVLMGSGIGWTVRDRSAREAEAARMQAERQAKLAGQLDLIFTEVDRLEREQKWPAALAATRRAEALVAGGGGDPALAGQVQRVLADLNLVERLEEIRLERTAEMEMEWERERKEWADDAYATAFRDAGVDLDQLTEEEAVERLGARTQTVAALAAALDDWALGRHANRNAAGAASLRAVALAIDPHPWRQQVRQAIARRDGKTLERLAAAPDVVSQSPATLFLLGRALCSLDLLDQGIALLRNAQRLHAGDFWINFELGSRLALMGPAHQDDALAFHRAAAALRPNSAVAWVRVGAALSAQGAQDEARACLARATELNPNYAGTPNELGRIFANEKKLDEAIVCFAKAIELDPRFVHPRYNLGLALKMQNKLDQAIAPYWKVLELSPNHVKTHRDLAQVIQALKNRDEIIAFFRKAGEGNPQNASAHYYLGVALWHQGKLEESLGQFTRACELRPSEARHHFSLANNLRALKKLDEALVAYEKSIELKGASAEYHYEFAVALELNGRHADAISSWKKSLEIDDKFVRAHMELAWLLATTSDLKLRDPQAALAHARQAVELQPQTRNHWSNLGVALLRTGNSQAAVEALEKADQMAKNGDHVHRFFLAMAYWQTGAQDKGRQAYDQGVQWMNKNRPQDEVFRRFRAEAEELLGITSQPSAAECGRLDHSQRFSFRSFSLLERCTS